MKSYIYLALVAVLTAASPVRAEDSLLPICTNAQQIEKSNLEVSLREHQTVIENAILEEDFHKEKLASIPKALRSYKNISASATKQLPVESRKLSELKSKYQDTQVALWKQDSIINPTVNYYNSQIGQQNSIVQALADESIRIEYRLVIALKYGNAAGAASLREQLASNSNLRSQYVSMANSYQAAINKIYGSHDYVKALKAKASAKVALDKQAQFVSTIRKKKALYENALKQLAISKQVIKELEKYLVDEKVQLDAVQASINTLAQTCRLT